MEKLILKNLNDFIRIIGYLKEKKENLKGEKLNNFIINFGNELINNLIKINHLNDNNINIYFLNKLIYHFNDTFNINEDYMNWFYNYHNIEENYNLNYLK